MKALHTLSFGTAAAVLAGCSLPPVDLHTVSQRADAPDVEVVDARGLPNPNAVGAQLRTAIFVSPRPVPDYVREAVSADLARHGIHAGTLRMTVRIGRFGLDASSQGSFHDSAQAVWGVFVSDSAGAPRCAVAIHILVPVQGAHRAEALQSALDQASEQAAAAASCPQGLGL